MAWLFAGCVPGETARIRSGAPFDSIFELVDTIVLDESLTDPIVDLKRISVASDGRIVFADHRAARIRIFTATGRAIAALGRHGDGPGEFRRPIDAHFVRSSVLVTDVAAGRITRYDADFELDTIMALEALPTDIVTDGSDLVLLTGVPSRVLAITSNAETRFSYPVPDSSADQVPYWGSVLNRSATVFGRDLVVATNLQYPLWRHDLSGATTDSVGIAPSSFVPASKPVRGQFVGAAQADVTDWLETFNVIDRIGTYRDSLLFVVHGRYEPFPGEPWNLVHTNLDAYDVSYEKVLEDIPVPGRILRISSHVYVLLREPPAPWTIGRYQLRASLK